MILLFPQNRIQALLASLEGSFGESLEGLQSLAASVSGRLPRRQDILTALDAHRGGLIDAAFQRYDGWRDAVAPYAETSGEYVAALAQILGRLTENTQQTGLRAARHVQALALALLVSLGALVGRDTRRNADLQLSPERRQSPAQRFSLACRSARVPIRLRLGQSAIISALAHHAGIRYSLPLPRSEFPIPA